MIVEIKEKTYACSSVAHSENMNLLKCITKEKEKKLNLAYLYVHVYLNRFAAVSGCDNDIFNTADGFIIQKGFPSGLSSYNTE